MIGALDLLVELMHVPVTVVVESDDKCLSELRGLVVRISMSIVHVNACTSWSKERTSAYTLGNSFHAHLYSLIAADNDSVC